MTVVIKVSDDLGVLLRQALCKIVACIFSLNCYHTLYGFDAKKMTITWENILSKVTPLVGSRSRT